MFDLNQENKEKNFEKRLKQLELEHEALKRASRELLDTLQLSQEEIAHNLLEENIPEDLRSHVAEEREKLELALQKAQATAADPRVTQRKHQERGEINHQWLYIR